MKSLSHVRRSGILVPPRRPTGRSWGRPVKEAPSAVPALGYPRPAPAVGKAGAVRRLMMATDVAERAPAQSLAAVPAGLAPARAAVRLRLEWLALTLAIPL